MVDDDATPAGGARCAGAGCFVRHLVAICRRGDPYDVCLDDLQKGRVDLKARFIAAASSREAIIKMAELAVDEARRLEPTGDAQEGADARS